MQFLQGGFSSIKNVASSVAKKIDEMKDVMSVDNKHFRSNEQIECRLGDNDQMSASVLGSRRSEPDLWGHSNDSTYSNLIFLGEHLAKNFPNLNQANCPHITISRNQCEGSCEIEIHISTSTPYHKCIKQMTDKDIMAGWSAEDSNLNTYCDDCKNYTVPVLEIETTRGKEPIEQHSFPYLNPLVLRKELENILVQHGDNCLCKYNFVEEHPIIYWNLVWFMERIGIQTHLPDLFYTKMVI